MAEAGERWVLRVSLGAHRPRRGERSRGMVYLFPPGPRPKVRSRSQDADGLPLWFLSRAPSALRDLATPREPLPPDRRHLRAWARAVRPVEVNVEVSDLGTVLEARYEVPEGLWVYSLLTSRAPGLPPPAHEVRLERLERVGDPPPPPLELLRGTARYHVRVERQGQEGGG